ncbi:hypothetical protein F4Z99_10735 [Candidatus Poribacteria bacterium]|nr:hypothetical protein [Candidatus Poribacteria bacterium]MYA98654.1 hypothetical protein [Candidatus Poribacteria bacterium]
MKRLSLLSLFFVVGLYGCETINPLCTENYCVEGKIYGKSLLPEDAEYGELPINDSQLLGAITGSPVAPIANFVSVYPASGGTISALAKIQVFFDNPPIGVIVTTGEVHAADHPPAHWEVRGNAVEIWGNHGVLPEGLLELTITWANGSQELYYVVITPDFNQPKVGGGTVADGDTNVDPEIINRNGIEIQFNEEVSGIIELQNTNGDNVGWIGRVAGNKATLELVKGKEIGYGTTYVIAGEVTDAAGNRTVIHITFATIIDE